MNRNIESRFIKRFFYLYLKSNEIVPENIINKEENKNPRYLDDNYYIPYSIKFINSTLTDIGIKINYEKFNVVPSKENIVPIVKKNYFNSYINQGLDIANRFDKLLENNYDDKIVLYRVNIYGNKLLDILLNIDQSSVFSKTGFLQKMFGNIPNYEKTELYELLNNNITSNTNIEELLLKFVIEYYNAFKKDIGIMYFRETANLEENYFKNLIVRKNLLIKKDIILLNCIVTINNEMYFENIICCDLKNKKSKLHIDNINYIKYLFNTLEVNYSNDENINIITPSTNKINIIEVEFDPNDKDEELPVIEIVVNNKTKRFLLGKTNNLYEDDNHLNNLVGKLKFLDDTYTKATVFWSENYLM